MKININSHSSIQIDDIYFDPFQIDKAKNNAKYIFITHTHYDHLSLDDIDKVVSDKTVFIATPDAKETLENKYNNKIVYVSPYDNIFLSDIEVEVLPSYNINKAFHKKEFGWVGYKKEWIEYENIERSAGETKWSFWSLFVYAIDGIVAFSTAPLLISSAIGLLFCLISLKCLLLRSSLLQGRTPVSFENSSHTSSI